MSDIISDCIICSVSGYWFQYHKSHSISSELNSLFNSEPVGTFIWNVSNLSLLTHWGRVTHICVSDLTSIGSDNGLSPGRRQAIIKTNAGILLIRPLGTNFSEFLVEILIFSLKKIAFESVVCEKAAILSRPQWVKWTHIYDITQHGQMTREYIIYIYIHEIMTAFTSTKPER